MIRPSRLNQMGQDHIRIMIVDDNFSVRSALEALMLLYDDVQIVGMAENGQEATQLCAELQPDVVLMDMLMPVMDGLTASAIIRQSWPQVRIIALSNRYDYEYAEQALQVGIDRCLSKSVGSDEIVGAIRAARAELPRAALAMTSR